VVPSFPAKQPLVVPSFPAKQPLVVPSFPAKQPLVVPSFPTTKLPSQTVASATGQRAAADATTQKTMLLPGSSMIAPRM
jgi:hypothetical protein